MFFPKSDFQQQKKNGQEAYKQSSGVGMHQNPHFQLKPVKIGKFRKSGSDQPSLFLSLHFPNLEAWRPNILVA